MLIFSVFCFSGDLWRTVPAARSASHRRHVHHTAYRTLQTAARIFATSCILDCLCPCSLCQRLSNTPRNVSFEYKNML